MPVFIWGLPILFHRSMFVSVPLLYCFDYYSFVDDLQPHSAVVKKMFVGGKMHRAFGIIPGQVTGYSTKASLCGKKYTEFQTRKIVFVSQFFYLKIFCN